MNGRGITFLSIAAAFCCAALLAACGGNAAVGPTTHNNSAQPAIDDHAQPNPDTTGSPTPAPSPPNVWTGPGHISGLDDQFNPVDGNTGSFNGQPVDGVTCAPTMSNNYHVHVFVGVYVNGVHYAIPDTIGMFHPQPEPTDHFTKYAHCYYDVHLHDASGIVHVESTDPNHVPITGTIYNTKQLFDEWGITVDGSHFGPFTGSVLVYTSGQLYRGGPGNGVVHRSTYTQWTGDPNAIPLYSHEAMFFEVGPNYPTVLPNIIYYAEF
jgi:hypothetical protein